MPQSTVLHDHHVRLGARIVDFHGWLLPVQYAGVLAEHKACREAAAIFDTGHMGQFHFAGPAAAEALGHVLTQDAAGLEVGRCQYGFLLNAQGGIIDDTILMRLGEEEFLLVVNAGTMPNDWQWITSHLPAGAVADEQDTPIIVPTGGGEFAVVVRAHTADGASEARAAGVPPASVRESSARQIPDCGILARNLSSCWSKLDLQGPRSVEVLAPMVDFDLKTLRYFRGTKGACAGRPCIISRTGYTGELGYEIFAPRDSIVAIFEALIANPIVKPAGLGARDSLRLEMCYPLYGEDINDQTDPLEADLGHFVNLGRDFVGKEPLAQEAQAGPPRKLVAFRSAGRKRAAHGNAILAGGKEVGQVTSGGFAPSLNVSIGMGYVAADCAAAGTGLTIQTDRGELEVEICDKPLYKGGTCRKALL